MSGSRLIGPSVSVLFALAALGAVYLAAAETIFREDSIAAVEWATYLDRLAPSASYFERLAELDEGKSASALDAALAADPRGIPVRIARALAAEREGRPADAQRDLREAARLDRQYLPAWTLANFFYRHNDAANFWIWARRAASLTGDFRPLLQLANAWEDQAGADRAAEVLSRLNGATKLGNQAIERAELDALIARGDEDGVQVVARSLASRHLPEDKPRLEMVADWQIRAGRVTDAVELWNSVWNNTLDPAAGRVLTNGDFQSAPLGLGFDWRLPSYPGVAAQWQPSRIAFSLSGAQPEAFALLDQTIPLSTRPIRLRFEYATAQLQAPTGVRWSLDGEDGPILAPSPDWKSSSIEFTAKTRTGRLVLSYRREPGSVRAPGTLEIRNVRLEKF